MERNTLGTFLWILVTVIVMLALVAFASPFGMYVRDNLDTFTGDYIDGNITDEPVDTLIYNIRVRYEVPDDNVITPPTEEKFCKEGETFSFISPTITGFTPNYDVVKGVATKDVEFVVIYSYAEYKIQFKMNGGSWNSLYEPPSSYIFKSSFGLPTSSNMIFGWPDMV